MSIKDNIEYIKSRIDRAAAKSGRTGDDVLLVVVTKLHTTEEMNEAIDAGITDIAENKVQEIVRKYDDVKPARWHLIGHLQTNKVRQVIDKVCMIHSVDSLHLAREIDKRAGRNGIVMDVLVQVNTAHEDSKFGVPPEDADDLIAQIAESCENIRIRGIMCMAPFEIDPEDARPFFAEAKKIFDRYASRGAEGRIDFRYLSMGMTNDYEVAIEEGSNLVRVGTAIFGNRDYRSEEK